MTHFYLPILTILILLLSSCFDTKENEDALYKDWTPKKFYNEAKLELSGGELEKALDLFKRLQANYPASKYAPQSRLDAAYALYDHQDYNEALKAFNHYIELYPTSANLDYAYYMRGVISEGQSYSILDGIFVDRAQKNISGTQEALKYYLALINRFPDSKYSREIVKKLSSLRNEIAKHELLVATFYYRKKSYIASVNRLQYLLKHYPNTPTTPVALTLLIANYDKIDLQDKKSDIERLFKLNFPKLNINLKKELALDDTL